MGSTPVTDRTSGSTTESAEINFLEAVPAIDRSPKLSEDDRVKKLQPLMPNLPIVYWQENKKKKVPRNITSCTKFPDIYDLHFNNKYWQVLESSNGSFYLYGAYLDVRASNRLGPTVRVLGMINRLEPQVKTQCQLWFSDSPGTEPVVSKVLEYKYIWYKKWGNYKQGLFQPYLLACQLPKSHWGSVPSSVSIVEQPCDTATSNLRVIYNKPAEGEQKKKFAVCVKGLDFPDDDLSVRLIEWIELLTTLGADKIFLYNLEVHPNVTKVLEHYTSQGKVDVTPISLPGHQPNLPVLQHMYLKSKLNNKRQNELIPYNDCLYRNMYRYEYVALLDIDEVIMPIKHNNWAEMMDEVVKASLKVKNETRASWNFRNVYFMDEMTDLHEPQHFSYPPLPTHAPTRLQERQLHEAWTICEVLPQSPEGIDLAQSLPSWMPGRCLHILSGGHRPWSLAALSQRLRQHSQEVLQERLQECQCERHHHMEVEGPSDTENIRCSFETGIFWFFKAP